MPRFASSRAISSVQDESVEGPMSMAQRVSRLAQSDLGSQAAFVYILVRTRMPRYPCSMPDPVVDVPAVPRIFLDSTTSRPDVDSKRMPVGAPNARTPILSKIAA